MMFEVFWNTMNQRYNYFYEQSSFNWETVYNEYAPKFKKLKTFNRDKQYSKAEISEDCNKANEYKQTVLSHASGRSNIEKRFRYVYEKISEINC